MPRVISQEQRRFVLMCGGVLRDAQNYLPFGVLAWLPTKPRAKEIRKTALALMVGATII